MILVTRCSIQHAEDLEDIAVALIAMKLIASAIKTKYQLSRAATVVSDGTERCVRAHSAGQVFRQCESL
jgi:hypothetical protein